MSSSSPADPKAPNSEPKTLEAQPSNPPLMDAKDPEKEKLLDDTEQSEAGGEDQGAEGEGEEEEEEECGFCLFMKGGGCKDTFTAWEDCIKEAEEKSEDIVAKCAQVTVTLRQCMEAHSDYYAPLLQAEKDMEEQAKKELQEEEEAKKVPDDSEKQDSSSN